MVYRKLFIFSVVFALAGVVSASSPAFARGSENVEPARTETNRQSHTEDDQSATDDQSSNTEKTRTEMNDQHEQSIETHKTELKDRVEAMKENRTEKLETKRLEVCQKRQSKINNIGSKSTEQNKKQLAVFQKIEANVEQFYVNKNLSAEGYDAAVAAANEKEAIAVASVEASAEVTFDCTTTDGAKPGSAIKELMTSRHDALRNYRTAIKDLIVIVKKAIGQKEQASSSTKPETTSTTAGGQ